MKSIQPHSFCKKHLFTCFLKNCKQTTQKPPNHVISFQRTSHRRQKPNHLVPPRRRVVFFLLAPSYKNFLPVFKAVIDDIPSKVKLHESVGIVVLPLATFMVSPSTAPSQTPSDTPCSSPTVCPPLLTHRASPHPDPNTRSQPPLHPLRQHPHILFRQGHREPNILASRPFGPRWVCSVFPTQASEWVHLNSPVCDFEVASSTTTPTSSSTSPSGAVRRPSTGFSLPPPRIEIQTLGNDSLSVSLNNGTGWVEFKGQQRNTEPVKFKQGDTVLCGFNAFQRTVFFTKKGVKEAALSVPFATCFPAISLEKFTAVHCNFGDEPFHFDVYGIESSGTKAKSTALTRKNQPELTKERGSSHSSGPSDNSEPSLTTVRTLDQTTRQWLLFLRIVCCFLVRVGGKNQSQAHHRFCTWKLLKQVNRSRCRTRTPLSAQIR
mgnify:CR=1 FL=1